MVYVESRAWFDTLTSPAPGSWFNHNLRYQYHEMSCPRSHLPSALSFLSVPLPHFLLPVFVFSLGPRRQLHLSWSARCLSCVMATGAETGALRVRGSIQTDSSVKSNMPMLFGLRQRCTAMASVLSATTCMYTFFRAHNDEGTHRFTHYTSN